MKSRYRIIGVSFLVVLLVLIRYFEEDLFYDPLIQFYQSDYLNNRIPHFLTGPLLLNVLLRFSLNTLISLGIIYVSFFDKNIVKFSFLLYIMLFLICFSAFSFLILTIENENYMALFYIRRFLIHPIFVIILIPAFYYYRLNSSGRYGRLNSRF